MGEKTTEVLPVVTPVKEEEKTVEKEVKQEEKVKEEKMISPTTTIETTNNDNEVKEVEIENIPKDEEESISNYDGAGTDDDNNSGSLLNGSILTEYSGEDI